MNELRFVRICMKSYVIWMSYWLAMCSLLFIVLLAMQVPPFAFARWISGNAGNPFQGTLEKELNEQEILFLEDGELPVLKKESSNSTTTSLYIIGEIMRI